jgi:hypothetical protein
MADGGLSRQVERRDLVPLRGPAAIWFVRRSQIHRGLVVAIAEATVFEQILATVGS